jgi:membrane protease YdiL (CAAX protease family)
VIEQDRSASEVGWFFAIAFGATAVLHGSIAALGLSFSLSPNSPVLALYLLGLATPAATAVWLSGPAARRSFLRSTLRPSRSPAVYAFALVAQPGLLALASLLSYAADQPAHPRFSVAGGFGLLALGQVWVVLGEELGWRGFALPRLLRLGSARSATLLLALMWGVWHAPMFFVPASLQAREPTWLFAAAVLVWACVHTALYLRGRPSIVPNLVFHGSANLVLNLVEVPVPAQGSLACAYAAVGLIVWYRLGHSLLADARSA